MMRRLKKYAKKTHTRFFCWGIRGRSQTTFTRFVSFWQPNPICLHFLRYKSLQKVDFSDHLPPSSCKRSLRTPPIRQIIRGENRWDLSPNIFVSCHFDFSWFGNSGIIINKFKFPFQTPLHKIVKDHLPYLVNDFEFSWFDHSSGIIIIKNSNPPFKSHFMKFSSIIFHFK